MILSTKGESLDQFISDLKAVLAEGPEREEEIREQGDQLTQAEESLAAFAKDDPRLQMILAQGKAIQGLTERNAELELLIVRIGIESLERIKQLERQTRSDEIQPY